MITTPAYITKTSIRDHQFGYPTLAGFYLAVHHLTRLHQAARSVNDTYQVDFTDEFDTVAAEECASAGLLVRIADTDQYVITSDGLWHLSDRGWI
jgi:hypothetical protein